MQIVRFFIVAAIIAFVPVLAFPVSVESQELLAREPSSIGDWFNGVAKKFKETFSNLGKTLRSIGKPKASKTTSKSKSKSKSKPTPTPTPTPATVPVESRELRTIYARDDDDGIYIRGLDDEIYGREFDDDLEAREFEDELEARDFNDELDVRELIPR
jgi:hypothetical protein